MGGPGFPIPEFDVMLMGLHWSETGMPQPWKSSRLGWMEP